MAELDYTQRAPVLHHWARTHYCGSDLPHISCDHRRLSGSCASGPIFPCFAGRLPGCSVDQRDLWPYLHELCRNESTKVESAQFAQSCAAGSSSGSTASRKKGLR